MSHKLFGLALASEWRSAGEVSRDLEGRRCLLRLLLVSEDTEVGRFTVFPSRIAGNLRGVIAGGQPAAEADDFRHCKAAEMHF